MMNVLFISGIFVALFVYVTAQTPCEDIDSVVCNRFHQHIDVCSDPCFSKLCPRHCKKCPLKCFHCDKVSALNQCNTTQICPGTDHRCIVTESLNDDFTLSYKLGCASTTVCDRLFGTSVSNVVGRRTENLNGQCCLSDLCNDHTTPLSQFVDFEDDTSTKDVTMTLSTTGTPSAVCADIDTLACQRLYSVKRDMCSDTCMAQACPGTCGKCAQCYSCDHVAHPKNCTKSLSCLPGEKCYVLETLSSSDTSDHGYKVGCIHEKVCSKFHSQASSIFGKRGDTLELSLNGDCCSGDLCNNHPLHTTETSPLPSTTPTAQGCPYTESNHHCPTGFHLVNGKCYLFGNQEETYDKAQKYCSRHCGSILAEDLSSNDLKALSIQAIHSSHTSHRMPTVYIGAEYTSGGTFVWKHSRKVAFINLHTSLRCLKLEPHHHLQYAYDDTRCENHNYPLCQAPMK